MKKKIPFTRALSLIIRIILIIAPLAWIYSRMEFGRFLTALEKIPLWLILFISANTLIAMFLQGVRWWVLMKAFLPRMSFTKAISYHFKGLFYSIVLPTSAAQDIVRAALMASRDDYAIVWGATWVCRVLGLLALAVLSFCGFVMVGPSTLPAWLIQVIAISFAAVFALAAFSFFKTVTRIFRPVALKILPKKISAVIDDIRQAIYLYRQKIAFMFLAGGISIIIQLLIIANAIILIKGISGIIAAKECLFFIPAIEIIVVSVPLTPNGMGLREGLLSIFLISFLSFTPEQVGIYVLVGFLGIILRLAGAAPILYDLVVSQRRDHSTK